MSNSLLPDKLAETQRRLADLQAKADSLRRNIAKLGQSTITGERYIATVRRVALYELDPERLRKRISPEQLDLCRVPVDHVVVTVHERDGDE